MSWPHTGALLTGGSSVRMGTPKGSLPLPNGKTMASTVSTTLGELCARVVAVGQPLDDLSLVPDVRPGRGPLGGIEALLLSGIDSEYLVCSTDTPLLSPRLLRRLTEAGDSAAAIFEIEGDPHVQSLPVRIGVEALAHVSASLDDGRNAIYQILQIIDVAAVPIGPEDAAELVNINNPEDYARIASE